MTPSRRSHSGDARRVARQLIEEAGAVRAQGLKSFTDPTERQAYGPLGHPARAMTASALKNGPVATAHPTHGTPAS